MTHARQLARATRAARRDDAGAQQGGVRDCRILGGSRLGGVSFGGVSFGVVSFGVVGFGGTIRLSNVRLAGIVGEVILGALLPRAGILRDIVAGGRGWGSRVSSSRIGEGPRQSIPHAGG